ncbi:MAG: amino acid permease [Gemmatimonadetes bacterium]|nr:amino acid permease [Gemmatimonadota bacterium]
MTDPADRAALARVVGLPGAVLLGLGSIVGTGAFVSIGIAAGVAGPSVVLAIALAACLATCNGLSSAQLAADHPVSGGTYEYGYRYLTPTLGFMAGWTFLCAKSASAATAALGLAGYALDSFGVTAPEARVGLAVFSVGCITALVIGGMTRSNRVNGAIVTVTLFALAAFVVLGAPTAVERSESTLSGMFSGSADIRSLLEASALMFVAYTGYGRIATLGEEVREPRRTIPRAIIVTLAISAVLYISVSLVAVGAVGAGVLAELTAATAAPLEEVARTFSGPVLPGLLAVAAITAMLGVLLNLVLGLSRVLLAMARRADAPASLARIEASSSSPRAAVLAVGSGIALIALIGDIGLTWSFSAFTVLVYYAITNLAALRLSAEARLYPRWIPAAGLVGCVGLAFWVEPRVWLVGLAMIGAGLVGRAIVRGRE